MLTLPRSPTGRTNIPALRQDVLDLARHLDRLTRTHSADRATIRDALLRLTNSVEDLRTNTTPATSPALAFRELEERVHRLAQGLEREEDTRSREIGVMDTRMGSLEDDTRDISRSVTTVSRELAGAIGALSLIRASLSTITEQVGELGSSTLGLTGSAQSPRESALSPSTQNPRRRDRPVSPSPAPTPGGQRRPPRPPLPLQPPGEDGRTTVGRPPKRPRGNGQRVSHASDQHPLPAPLPAPLPGPAAVTVRFGAVGWSADIARLRAEVLSTAHAAWNAIPNAFESVVDLRRDPADTRFVLIQFPSRFLAHSFVSAWVQNGHREQTLRTVHADIL